MARHKLKEFMQKHGHSRVDVQMGTHLACGTIKSLIDDDCVNNREVGTFIALCKFYNCKLDEMIEF